MHRRFFFILFIFSISIQSAHAACISPWLKKILSPNSAVEEKTILSDDELLIAKTPFQELFLKKGTERKIRYEERFVTYTLEDQTKVHVRSEGSTVKGDHEYPLFLTTYGKKISLTPAEFSTLERSEAAYDLWHESIDVSGQKKIVGKGAETLPKSAENLTPLPFQPELPPNTPLAHPNYPVGSEIKFVAQPKYEAHLIDQNYPIKKTGKIGVAMKNKKGVALVYSQEANEASKTVAYSQNEVQLKGAINGSSHLINVSELDAKIGPTKTLIHEIGHSQTRAKVEAGVADPMAIQYYAGEKYLSKTDFRYTKADKQDFFQGDEARQWASNLIFSFSQRPESEVVELMKQHQKLPISTAFGVNLDQFWSTVSNMENEIKHLNGFNDRATHFAQVALERIKKLQSDRKTLSWAEWKTEFNQSVNLLHAGSVRFAELKILEDSQIRIPIVSEVVKSELDKRYVFQVKAQADSGDFEEVFKYLTDYLENAKEKYQAQKLAIRKAESHYQSFTENPHREISLSEFFQIKDDVSQVKKTVLLNQRDWMSSRPNAEFNGRYQPKFQPRVRSTESK